MNEQVGPGFLIGAGEMSELIRAKDWSETPLGPVEHWPQSLRTTVSLCLASNFPINIIWGPEHTQIYNDGYRVVCGDAHPTALGQDYNVTWASAWPAVGEPFSRALAGETTFIENQRMFLTRNGYLEETFFTFSTSPIRDESGGIGGLFHPVTETTATMLAERRTRALRDLTANLGGAADLAELATLAIGTLAGFDLDLPFVLLYELSPDSTCYRLAAHHGLEPGIGASPATLDVDATVPWPIAEAVDSLKIVGVQHMASLVRGAACGPYDEAPDYASCCQSACRALTGRPSSSSWERPRACRSTTCIAAFTSCSPPRFPPPSRPSGRARTSVAVPRRLLKSTAPKPRSSPTCHTSSERR